MTRQLVALGDALSLLIDHRGKTPKKLGGDWSPAGHRVVSAINIKDNRVDSNDHHYVNDELYAKWMKDPLRAGDVLLTSEAPTGEVAYLDRDTDWCLGQRVFGLRGRPGLLSGRYLYYLLRGGPVRHDLLARATGTTVSGIRQAELVKVELLLPSMDEQNYVASVLGSLDKKIESNQRAGGLIYALLEQEFRRLLSIERPERVDLAKLVSTVKGVSYTSAELQPSSVALVTLKSINRNGGYRPDGLKPYVGKYKPQQAIESGEVVVAQTDLTQGAEVVGRAVRVPADSLGRTLVASLDLQIVRPSDGLTQEYLFGVLTDPDFRQHCRDRTNGTTVLHLASDAVPTYSAPLMSKTAQNSYTSLARPLLQRADALSVEIELLSQLRDTLLPEVLVGHLIQADSRTLEAAGVAV